MKGLWCGVAIGYFVVAASLASAADTIVAIQEEGWFYEDGEMKKEKGGFENTYVLTGDRLVRTKVRNLETNEATSDNTVYLVRSELASHPARLPRVGDPAASSKTQPFPPVIRAVGNPGTDATELVVIGADFVQTCKSTADYFVISRFKRVK